MKVRLITNLSDPSSNITPDLSFKKGRDVTIWEGIIPDYRFDPDVITLNGQDAYTFAFRQYESINEGQKETVRIYRKAICHNVVVERKDLNKPTGVGDDH